ncbi:MAG: hypothetical protein INR71_02095 [Terriglobus roseus]|nr:hypothetical protein [Terriglobus roseus]
MEDQDRIVPTPSPAHDKSPIKHLSRSASHSPVKQQSQPQTPLEGAGAVETIGGDITLKMEPGKGPKLSRSHSQKVIAKPPTLYLDEPDKTPEACSDFLVIQDCIYSNKHIGTTEAALDCDCDDEWGESKFVSVCAVLLMQVSVADEQCRR